MSHPNVPLLHISNEHWQVGCYDPRVHPERLGPRYIHGGWIAKASFDGQAVSGACETDWHNFDGVGWPETFESGLGADFVEEGAEFLRVGAGRVLQNKIESEEQLLNKELTTLLDWDVQATDTSLVMTTRDGIKKRKQRLGYSLKREVLLEGGELVSRTTFTLNSRDIRQAWLSWFVHPFFPQTNYNGTGFEIPDVHHLNPESGNKGTDGLWRVSGDGARPVFGNCWGKRLASTAHLENGLKVHIQGDWPMDHIVVWASNLAASIEPKWARCVQAGESFTWSLRYSVSK